MAKTKRMISCDIVKNDNFIEMSKDARALYYQLQFEADDEGFIDNILSTIRMADCSKKDLDELLQKRFLLDLGDGIYVIKHWLIHNRIPNERIIETKHLEKKTMLTVKENLSYTLKKYKEVQPKANLYKEIIDYLNLKSNRSYKSNTQKTISVINARLNEGFNIDDFKKVIDIKVKDWLNNKDMSKFLRPETLFGNKFEGYLNSIPTKKNETNNEFSKSFTNI